MSVFDGAGLHGVDGDPLSAQVPPAAGVARHGRLGRAVIGQAGERHVVAEAGPDP